MCVPVWNGAQYAATMIESVLAQRGGVAWRLYIGDNASSDGLRSIVAGYDDDRITYHRWERHVGPSENFNRTIALAESPWVLPIGVDDRLDDDALERMAAGVSGSKTPVAMVLAPCRRVGLDGTSVDREYYGATPPIRVPPGRYGASRWLKLAASGGPFPWTIGSIAFDRGTLVESGAFRPDVGLAADMELIFRLPAYGDALVLEGPVMSYLVHADSDGNLEWVRNLRDPHSEVPLARALLSALAAHQQVRTVSPHERRLVRRGAAMTYVQRATQHRLHDGAGGRRGAASDLRRAWRLSPTVFLGARAAAMAIGALAAPSATLRWASAAMRRGR